MASIVEIIIKATDQSAAVLQKTSKEMQGIDKSAQRAAKSTNGLMNSLKGMINPTNMAVAAVTGLALYLRNATKAAGESAQVDAKLTAVLKATGNAAGMTAREIDAMSANLSKLTGIDDEVVKSGAAVMLTFRNIGEDVFPNAIKAQEAGIRTVIFRFGVVLGPDGGALQKMLIPFKVGLGGAIGDGRQPSFMGPHSRP